MDWIFNVVKMEEEFLDIKTAESVLTKIGLSSEESRVYTTILLSGVNRASDISKITDIRRPKVYQILERLNNIGVIDLTSSNPLSFVVNNVKEFIDSKIQAMEKDLDNLKANSRIFISKYGNWQDNKDEHSKSGVKFLKSRDSILNEVNKLVSATSESVKLVIDTDKFYIFDNLKTESILVKKIQEGINLHVITGPDEKIMKKLTSDPSISYYLRFFPHGILPNFIIVDNRYIISLIGLSPGQNQYQHSGPYGLKISSKNYVKKMENLFDYLWESSVPSNM